MSRLDLKIPPDLVALAVAALMWLVSSVTPSINVPSLLRVPTGVVFLSAGAALIAAARVSFDRAGTTFSPLAPGRSSRLVTSGVYRWSRNPMYLGTQFALFGLAVLQSNVYSLVVSLAHVLYMNRFQIRPEERVLSNRFGPEYEAYVGRVRRWV